MSLNVIKAYKELKLIESFNNNVEKLWEIEDVVIKGCDPNIIYLQPKHIAKRHIRSNAANIPEYKIIRKAINKDINEVISIASNYNINMEYIYSKSLLKGGAQQRINVFLSILLDTTDSGLERQIIIDAIDQTIGECEKHFKSTILNVINPFYWIWSIVTIVIRLPFIIFSLTGFNVEKIEDHLLAKFFKLIYMIILIHQLFHFGLTKENIVTLLK